MGETLATELPQGSVELVLTNVGSPNNARSAMTSPNWGPHMGFIRLALVRRRAAHAHRSSELADRSREILNRDFPGVEFLQWPGGPGGQRVRQRLHRAAGRRGPRRQAGGARGAGPRRRRGGARRSPACATCGVSLQMNYPEVRVETDRSRPAWSASPPATSAQTTLEATLGNINTPERLDRSATTASRTTWSPPTTAQAVTDPNALGAAAGARRRERQGRSRSAPTATSAARPGPIAIERNQLQRAAHVLDADRRPRPRHRRRRSRAARSHADPRTRHVQFDFVGQVELMRTTFSGLGVWRSGWR